MTSKNVSALSFRKAAVRLEKLSGLVPAKASRPAQVRLLQQSLTKLGYATPVTGVFSGATQAALKKFQADQSLTATGTFDAHTRAAMRSAITASVRANAPILTAGAQGSAVSDVQRELKELGLLSGPATGTFDANTRVAVAKYKKQQGWEASGIVGLRAWRALAAEKVDVPVTNGNGKQDTFTTVNLNIKNNPPMPHDKLMHDVRKAAVAGDLIGWNEIAPKSYFAAIKALGPGWAHYMPSPNVVQTPISWKKSKFKKLDAGVVKMHHGLAGVSPNRYVTWVRLQDRKTGQTIVRMNTHTVSGAFSNKHQSHRDWRVEHWQEHIQKLEKLIQKFSAKGDTVIVGGDFNRNHYPVLGKNVKYDTSLKEGTHGSATLDYLMHAPDKSIKTVRGRVLRGFNSDHDAVVVKYRLTGK